MSNLIEIAKLAKQASLELSSVSTELKNKALDRVAQLLEANKKEIIDANKLDLKNAVKLVESGKLTKSTYNRLKLDESKMRDMIKGVLDVYRSTY